MAQGNTDPSLNPTSANTDECQMNLNEAYACLMKKNYAYEESCVLPFQKLEDIATTMIIGKREILEQACSDTTITESDVLCCSPNKAYACVLKTNKAYAAVHLKNKPKFSPSQQDESQYELVT